MIFPDVLEAFKWQIRTLPQSQEQDNFKGYFNYYNVEEPLQVKTYNFCDVPLAEVNRLEKQFTNNEQYIYSGAVIVPVHKTAKR